VYYNHSHLNERQKNEGGLSERCTKLHRETERTDRLSGTLAGRQVQAQYLTTYQQAQQIGIV
jgi:hypothetical protein